MSNINYEFQRATTLILSYRQVRVKSSSAVAERPRDALCPSVVSLNKIITRTESLIDLPLRNVVFGVTLRLLVIHFVIVSRYNKLGRLSATSVINSLWSVAAKCIALAAGTVHSMP